MAEILGIYEPSLYGNFRTRTFSEIYSDLNTFRNDLKFFAENGLNAELSDSSIQTLYLILSARYMNSHIVNSSEDQFKLKLFSMIFQFAPTWIKKLDIQKKLRNISDDDLVKGATQIYNHSNNPSTAPSTQATEELPTVDDQNVSKYKRSKLDAYANLIALLENDVTESFVKRFAVLFIVIAEPQEPLWYTE